MLCQAEDRIRDYKVTGVQTCAMPIYDGGRGSEEPSPREGAQRGRRGVLLRGRREAREGSRSGEVPRVRGARRQAVRSEERRVGKSVDLGGRRIIKKKKDDQRARSCTG